MKQTSTKWLNVTKTYNGKYRARFQYNGVQYSSTQPKLRDAKAWISSMKSTLSTVAYNKK